MTMTTTLDSCTRLSSQFVLLVMLLSVPTFGPKTAHAQGQTDDEIRQLLIEQSIKAYSGSCACPYSRASDGSLCGSRSAWSRPGGAEPLCYEADVTDEMVTNYRIGQSQVVAYDRDDWLPSWSDSNGDCINTRHEVLIIESQIPVTMSSDGCFVSSGQWYDPATDQTFNNPSDVDIDHHVPLAEAHASGGYAWSNEFKQLFANDMVLREALVAMDDSTNSSKGARDPAQWLPPNQDYHCEYVRDWVEVKSAYGLTYDAAEQAAIEAVLGTVIDKGARTYIQAESTLVGETSAYFGMGLRREDLCGYAESGIVDESTELSFSILPREQDLDGIVDVILVLAAGSELYSINSQLQLVPFDGDIVNLAAYIESTTIRESVVFELLDSVFSSPLNIDIYIAYITTEGELVYSPTPFNIAIE